MSVEKYRVNVNGKEYYVEVEMVDEKPADLQTTSAAPVASTTATASANDVTVNAPMQGNIFKVLVQPNQVVKAGDVLIILEAMKMENEIVAPVSGTVSSILVNEGNSVDPQQALVTIKES
jgi:biotin carboxyl carrier protein